ncbi:TonB-dependent receptor [Hyphomicrobium sp. CS1GBMeth3]|uniref:TonB-dependent receptor n=1 Tax=Hyphomicrobium sp. CS1GBMeth3 TaxID=1892845 RepID=UPI0009F90BB1|nr:TonB-dependent receptor [Hyphomicrobium sp. CS1GBMeth3]
MSSVVEPAATPHCLSLGAQVSEGGFFSGTDGRKSTSSVKLFTTFALLAVSPTTIAQAQQSAEPAPLPPITVETTAKKKKQAAAKKKAGPTSPAPVAPTQAAAAPEPSDVPPLPGQAGPVAPGEYKTDYVSSAKVTGPLLDTPQTITVVPGTIIQERKTTNLIETLRQTPGITIDAGENAFGSGGNAFNIRGFNSTGSVFIDGTRDNGSYTKDVFNVEQVEIFKGPAADNGRGGAGGYVNIVTKKPQQENFVEGNVGIGFDEYDSEMRRRAALDVNQFSGTTAVRLNTFIQDGGLAGVDVAEANAWGVAPSVAFGLGTDTRAIFTYEHVERRDVPDAGVAINRARPLFGVGIDGAGPRPGVSNLPRDTFFGLSSDYDDVNADTFLARFEHDIVPGVTISNQTRWAQVDREARYHIGGNGSALPSASMFYYDRGNESIYNQTNLSARFNTGALRHTLATGVELSREKSDALRFTGADPTQDSNVQIDTISYYLYDTVDLSRHWQVVGGIRVDHYDVELEGDAIPGVGGATRYSDSDTSIGGKVGVVYKPVREGSLYASYGTGHLPHGALLSNPDISRTGGNGFPGFIAGADPVEMHNYEIGVKWDWFGGKLSTTAALFHTVKNNVAYLNGDDIVYGEQQVQGIELGIAGNLTDRWRVFGGLVLMDSERKHGSAVDAALGGDYGGNAENGFPGVTSTNGEQLAFTPKVFATLWSTYDVTDKITLGAGFQYTGESYIGRPDDALRVIPNGKYGKLPDYFLVNLMASYDITDNIELSLNVDNVFDETYLTTANWNGSWGYLGAPRTYWLSANFKY